MIQLLGVGHTHHWVCGWARHSGTRHGLLGKIKVNQQDSSCRLGRHGLNSSSQNTLDLPTVVDVHGGPTAGPEKSASLPGVAMAPLPQVVHNRLRIHSAPDVILDVPAIPLERS